MSSYPRTYAQATATGDHLNENDWDALVAATTGTTVTGVRAYPYDYLIRTNAGYYEAINSAHNLVYGGSDDAGSVSGSDCKALVNTVFALTGAHRVYIAPGYYDHEPGIETTRSLIIQGTPNTQFRCNIDGETPAWKLNAKTYLRDLVLTTQDTENSTDTDDIGLQVYGRFDTYPSGQFSRVDNVLISRFGTGIALDTGWNNSFYNIDLYNCYDGVKVTSTEGEDMDFYNSQFSQFFGGKIEECRRYPLWLQRAKYSNFFGTYISSAQEAVLLDNVKGINFQGVSFEPSYEMDYMIETPDTSPTYRSNLTFNQCLFSCAGAGEGHSCDGVQLIDTDNVKFYQPTIAAVYITHKFLDCTDNCTNIRVVDPVYNQNSDVTLLYLGNVKSDDTIIHRMVIPFAPVANQTDKAFYYIYSGVMSHSMIIHKLIATVTPAPGAGNSIAVNLHDSTVNDMTATITNTDVSNATTTGAFTLYKSSAWILRYTSSASLDSTLGSIIIEYSNRVGDPWLGD